MRAVRKMPNIKDLALFDSCVTLGRACMEGVPEFLTADNVVEVLDKYDIAEALVHSNEARLVRPRRRGNERLLEETRGLQRLHPVWVLEPPNRPDPAGARAMVEEMLAAGVRAARLMMGHVPPMHWIWKDLCEALEIAESGLVDALRNEMLTDKCVPYLLRDDLLAISSKWTPAQRYILSRIDGQRNLRSIIMVSPLKEVEALKTFRSLIKAGYVALR